MPIRSWHPGKLIILWAWGVVVVSGLLAGAVAGGEARYVLGTLLVAAAAAVPGLLSVITWKWLSGREGADADDRGQRPDTESEA